MIPIRVITIPSEVAHRYEPRKRLRIANIPRTEVAGGYALATTPCARFTSVEQRTLFTNDPFDGIEHVPLP